MRTVDYEDTKLIVVAAPSPNCSFGDGRLLVVCHLKASRGSCDRYCPDSNRVLPPDTQSHILLSPDEYNEYLAAKLMGDLP